MHLVSRLFLISLTTLLISCSQKQEKSFSISGILPNLNEKFIVLSVIEDFQQNKTSVIDTLKINKRGEFNSVYLLEPALYTLTFNEEKTILLAIDKGQHIVVKGPDLETILVTGSNDTDLLNSYESFREESLNRLVKSVRNKIKELQKTSSNETEIIALRELEVSNYKKHLNELTQFIQEKMGTSIAVYATSTRWNVTDNLNFYKDLVVKFEEKHASINITQKLKERLILLKKTSIGSKLSSIEMPSVSGEIIKLDSIHKKYTLIDFWASWCPPCRTESKLLNSLYASFNAEGFEIYGISLDSKKERWINALEKDARIWPNVSTVEGFKTKVSMEYGITSLPTNFLIDSQGKIIAANLHGNELKEKIEQLFRN